MREKMSHSTTVHYRGGYVCAVSSVGTVVVEYFNIKMYL